MDDRNKKQIIVLVVIIIILIFVLIGLLLYVVKDNNTVVNVDFSSTSNTTTKKIESNIEDEIAFFVDDYFLELKNSNKIGSYKVKDVEVLEYTDEFNKCLQIGYDETKLYVNVLLEYESIDNSLVLSNNISVSDNKIIADIILVFSQEEDDYNFYSVFLGC